MTRTAVAVLVLGVLPFYAIGLAFGYLVEPNSAPAVPLPIAFAPGLLIALSQLPEFVQAIAPFLRPYHHAQRMGVPARRGPNLRMRTAR